MPGGWASDKIVALGDEGRKKIRAFVDAGGSYLGICGGAGLALSHKNGLGLSASGRMPTSVRLPSFSGGINLEAAVPEHPMWKDCGGSGVFHAWWPGQFSLEEGGDDLVLARYGTPVQGSCVTDLPVYDSMDWSFWEKKYGINLNPGRIVGEPAVIETRFGKGKVILSYLHFETPGDENGHAVLLSLLEYLAGVKPAPAPAPEANRKTGSTSSPDVAEATAIAESLRTSTDKLISFGMNNFLWYQRDSWILQWRRGVRGVEYSTLYAILMKLADAVAALDEVDEITLEKLRRLREVAQPFFEDAPKLLLLERDAISEGPISPLRTGDEQILALRKKLFSESKRCGGFYKEIVDLADEILLPLLRARLKRQIIRGTHN
ncbi:MAG: BPL-N domain-containing protein [Thermoleophilia bacterium]